MTSPASAGSLGVEFEAVYSKHFAFVWRVLLHFGVPPELAEDGVQDVFMVVHRRFDDWDGRSPRSWLYGIARRVASGHRRTQARHQRKIAALPEPEAPGLEGRIADRQLLASLEQVLHRLDPGLREVFIMAEVEGMSAREVAEVLGANANTIYSRLRKARVEVTRALLRVDDTRVTKKERHGATR